MSYGDATYSGIVKADGTLTITFGPGAKTRTWTVSQVSTEMQTAPVGSTCALRKGTAQSLVSFLIATGDAAGGDPPVVLQNADTLTVKWAGCTPGDTGRVFIIYDEVRS